MAFFDDFAKAVENYPSISVTLRIVDVAFVSGAQGPEVNVNDVYKFQVRVINNGHLNLTNVLLHIQGQNGAQVSAFAAGPFSAGIVSSGLGLTVNAHGSQDTADFYFNATAASPAEVVLVRAHISRFNANLNHILDDHSSHADPPAGTYSRKVFPV